jgi:hypothetical protein
MVWTARRADAFWLRPDLTIHWIPPYNAGITVELHAELTPAPPDTEIEVTGIYASQEVRYGNQNGLAHRIIDARISLIHRPEDAPVDESIEVTYEDLRWNGVLNMLPPRVAEIDGKLVRIVGWCNGSHPDDDNYPIVDLRPDNIIPDWPEALVDFISVKQKKPRKIRPNTVVEVRGIFSFREERYHIDDAEIKVIQHYSE